jgi:hypothetical protein
MSPKALLTSLTASGLELFLEGSDLVVEGDPTDEQLGLLRAHKAALIKLLASPKHNPLELVADPQQVVTLELAADSEHGADPEPGADSADEELQDDTTLKHPDTAQPGGPTAAAHSPVPRVSQGGRLLARKIAESASLPTVATVASPPRGVEVQPEATKPFRLWDITKPGEPTYRVSISPPETLEQVLYAHPGSYASPVDDPEPGGPLPAADGAVIRALLDSIRETDPQTEPLGDGGADEQATQAAGAVTDSIPLVDHAELHAPALQRPRDHAHASASPSL